MEVFRILKGIPIAFTALILSIIPLLFIAGFNLMVINISEMQHDPTIKGFIYTIEGVAFMLGAFVIKRLSDHFKPENYYISSQFVLLLHTCHCSLAI